LDGGAIDCIENFLSSVGFDTKILTFTSKDGSNTIKNLFARFSNISDQLDKKVLGFLGHSDVVPAGDSWSVDPFAAVQRNGYLIGRGVSDMKGGIAAFCCAAATFVQRHFNGILEIFITGDEEVGSMEGVQSLIKWTKENDYLPSHCLIGEPSSDVFLGDRIFLGHRGSMNALVTAHGKQGHSACPANYKNSLTNLCKYVAKISAYPWKHEDKKFPCTNLEVTMLFTNNYAANVVPELSSANLNIRFGGDYSSQMLMEILEKEGNDGLSFNFNTSGEAYYCDNEVLKHVLTESIRETVGLNPYFSAAGGTSDGRFMLAHCDVIEFGLRDNTMHQKDEQVKIADLKNLERIYLAFLQRYFENIAQ
jgi:succinyl-diaminopimelate desuccinylase